MPNSTAEYWDVDGVSLQTYAQNLSSWGESREGVPPLRGEDQLIPFMPGRKFVKKIPDSRTITLKGWVAGVEAVETVARRNYAVNPVGPVSTAGYSASFGTGGTAAVTAVAEAVPNGAAAFMRATWSVASTGGGSPGLIYTMTLPLVLGDTRSGTVWVRSNKARKLSFLFRLRNSSAIAGFVQTAAITLNPNEWTELRANGAVATGPGTNIQAYALLDAAEAMAVGDTLDMSAPTIEDGPVAGGSFWGGMVPDTQYVSYRWEGTVNNSASRQVMLSTRGTRQAARNNWRALRDLLWTPRRQLRLTRRWYDASGTLQTATALGQFAGGLEPDVEAGGTRMNFSVDLFLADPFFYGAEVSVNLPKALTAVALQGDWSTTKARLELTGPLTAVSVAVMDPADPANTVLHQVAYTAVASGAVATLDIGAFAATEKVGTTVTRTTVKASHSGDRFWFVPEPNTAQIWPTAGSTGTIKYVYSPAWF